MAIDSRQCVVQLLAEPIAPADVTGLDADQRPAIGEAFAQSRQVDQLAEADFVHAACLAATQPRIHLAVLETTDGTGFGAHAHGIDHDQSLRRLDFDQERRSQGPGVAKGQIRRFAQRLLQVAHRVHPDAVIPLQGVPYAHDQGARQRRRIGGRALAGIPCWPRPCHLQASTTMGSAFPIDDTGTEFVTRPQGGP